MRCPSCGAQLPVADLDCTSCGASVGWWVRTHAGVESGPFTYAQMQDFTRRGALGPLDRVRIGLIGEWVPAPDMLSPAFQRPRSAVSPRRHAKRGRRGNVPALLIGGSVLIGLAGVVALAVTRPSAPPQRQDPGPICSRNLTLLARALRTYAQDHADGFPSWEFWGAAASTRISDRATFVCPAAPGEPGYAYNAALAGFRAGSVADPGRCVMLWDAGALGPYLAVSQSPRHDGGDNYAFVDGHVAWRLRGPYGQGDIELHP